MGAGLAGLTAAADLADAGATVTVLEKRPVVGGKVSSWDEGGYPVESGLHIFFGCYKELLGMVARVGASQNINWKQHRIHIARTGGVTSSFHFPAVPAPFNGIAAFAFNDLLTWHEKLTNIRALVLPWLAPLDKIARWDDRTYAEWHRGHGVDKGVLDKWWNPVALSMGFLDASEMSARPMTTVFHHFSREASASRVGFLDGSPAERLHLPFANYIRARGGQVETGQKVAEIELSWEDGQPEVTSVRLASGERIGGDLFVLAAPLHNTRKMIPPVLRHLPYFAGLWKLKSVPVMNVQLWYDHYVSDVDNLFFTSDAPFSVFADLAITSPLYDVNGGSLVSMAVAPAAALWGHSDHEIISRCESALNELWPRTRTAQVTHSTIVRIPNSIYREVPGSDTLRPTQRTPVRNLVLAGDYTKQDYMASMEGAVRSGHRAARLLLQQVATVAQVEGGRISVGGAAVARF